MTNEIKEILDIFKQVDLETDVGGCSNCPRRKDKNKTCIGCLNNAKDKLLDYITNLQEENKQVRENNLSMQEEMSLRWNELDNLQQQIDMALDLLNEPQFEIDNIPCNYEKDIEKLKNILRGDE